MSLNPKQRMRQAKKMKEILNMFKNLQGDVRIDKSFSPNVLGQMDRNRDMLEILADQMHNDAHSVYDLSKVERRTVANQNFGAPYGTNTGRMPPDREAKQTDQWDFAGRVHDSVVLQRRTRSG